MQLIVVHIAQRQRELVRHLEAHGPGLREFQMVRLRRAAAADEAGLRGNEGQMRLIAGALLLRDGEPPLLIGHHTVRARGLRR